MAIVAPPREDELVARGIRVLMKELGPLEAVTFLNRINPPQPGADSVKRRREWLNSIDEKALVEELLANLDTDPRIVGTKDGQ